MRPTYAIIATAKGEGGPFEYLNNSLVMTKDFETGITFRSDLAAREFIDEVREELPEMELRVLTIVLS